MSEDRAEQPELTRSLPEDVLILLPVRNLVLFPGVVLPVAMGRQRTIAAAQEAVRTERNVGFLLQRDPAEDDPGDDDLYRIGTVGRILRYVTAPDGTHHLVAEGEQRFRVLDFQAGFPFLVARVEYLREPSRVSAEVEARALKLKRQAVEGIELLPQAPAELGAAVRAIDSPGSWPTPSPASWTSSPPRSRRCSRRSRPGRAWSGSPACSVIASRCCASRSASRTRRATRWTSASASSCCASS